MARKSGTESGQGRGQRKAKAPPPEVELGALRDFIGFNLRLAQDASFRAFARNAGLKNIRPGRFAALMVLRDNPNITQSALGRAIARDKSSVTPLLQGLQRQGLVKRRRSTTDRRTVTLTLTPAGERELRELIVHARDHDRRLDKIAGETKAEFVAILRKVADIML
ncbi:MAG TPA: MarR family winged helix-turn-helix transcriptional regulator [Stellaceae bacterium]|jgi:DNA-binding MarR family transcriptional regulator|nr:MarR family winged helix-turn-helix transcriptional regulator [Stellaceae bacterium]